MNIRAFIFDLDGVLTDTAEYHFRAWKRLADEEGIPFTRADNEALRGVSRRESLLLLLKGCKLSEAEMLAWMERKNDYYVASLSEITRADILPGAQDLLAEIRQVGLRIAVASASKNAGTVIGLLGLGSSIDILVDGNTIQIAKPAPDLFLEAARQVGVPPEQCVVVEDAQAGVQAGIAAGMRTIGLGPVIRVGAADLVLSDLSGARLADLLQRLEG